VIFALAVVKLELVSDLVSFCNAAIAIHKSICMAEDVVSSIILLNEPEAFL